MKIRSVLLMGIIVLLFCMDALAEDKGLIQVIGMGSVVIPADTVTITVRAQSNNSNITQASTNSSDLLNKTKDALIEAGLNSDDISPGYARRLTAYVQRVCSDVNNTTVCRYETSNIVTNKMTIQMKRDEDMINKTLEMAKSSGATASISGYSIGDTKKVMDEVRKKAMDNAKQNAQDYASAYGFTLGKIVDISESPYPDIEIGSPRGYYPHFGWGWHNPFAFGPWGMGPFFGGKPVQPGMAYVKTFVRVTYEVT
jgi:uncharacterized protein YggE